MQHQIFRTQLLELLIVLQPVDLNFGILAYPNVHPESRLVDFGFGRATVDGAADDDGVAIDGAGAAGGGGETLVSVKSPDSGTGKRSTMESGHSAGGEACSVLIIKVIDIDGIAGLMRTVMHFQRFGDKEKWRDIGGSHIGAVSLTDGDAGEFALEAQKNDFRTAWEIELACVVESFQNVFICDFEGSGGGLIALESAESKVGHHWDVCHGPKSNARADREKNGYRAQCHPVPVW